MQNYKARYTKKAMQDIFNCVVNDDDFLRAFDKIYLKTCPQYNGKIESERQQKRASYFDKLQKDITFYLYDFDYLDKKYLDCAYCLINQYGKQCIVDLDTLYDIFCDC